MCWQVVSQKGSKGIAKSSISQNPFHVSSFDLGSRQSTKSSSANAFSSSCKYALKESVGIVYRRWGHIAFNELFVLYFLCRMGMILDGNSYYLLLIVGQALS